MHKVTDNIALSRRKAGVTRGPLCQMFEVGPQQRQGLFIVLYSQLHTSWAHSSTRTVSAGFTASSASSLLSLHCDIPGPSPRTNNVNTVGMTLCQWGLQCHLAPQEFHNITVGLFTTLEGWRLETQDQRVGKASSPWFTNVLSLRVL